MADRYNLPGERRPREAAPANDWFQVYEPRMGRIRSIAIIAGLSVIAWSCVLAFVLAFAACVSG